VRGTLVERYCQREAEVLGEKPVQLPFCQPQFEQELAGDLNPVLSASRHGFAAADVLVCVSVNTQVIRRYTVRPSGSQPYLHVRTSAASVP
jgi:hypothetical protein